MDKWIIAYYKRDKVHGHERSFLEFYHEDNAVNEFNKLKNSVDIMKVYLTIVIS